MTLSELIAHLQEMQEEIGADGIDPVIKIAYQPGWPLEESVSQVEMNDPMEAFYEEYGHQPPAGDDSPEQDHYQLQKEAAQQQERFIFFAGGFGGGYLTEGMATQLGWS